MQTNTLKSAALSPEWVGVRGTLSLGRSHVRYTAAPSWNGRLFAPLLSLCLGLTQAATANSNKTTEIWKNIDQFVVLAPQDAPAGEAIPPNDQPVVVKPADLAAALGRLQVYEGRGSQEAVPLFEAGAAQRLATQLGIALGRATADQDVLFAIEMPQKSALFGSNSVSVAGRAFFQNQRLHMIIGELHVSTVPPEYKTYPIGYPKLDRRLHPHQTGRRSQEARYDPVARFATGDGVNLYERDGKTRADWLVIDLGAIVNRDQSAVVPGMPPASESPHVAPRNVGTAQAHGGTSPSIEERLLRLKQLREQDLITEEEYDRKRKEILDQL
jgi:hypothetical protein